MDIATCRLNFKVRGKVIEGNHEFNVSQIQALSISKQVFITSENRYFDIEYIAYNTENRCFEVFCM